MADLLAPPAPPPLAPDERRKLLSAARRHRAAWLDDLCVGLAATRRSRECLLVDAICADAIPSAGAVVRALCKAAGDDGAVLPPGEADALDLLFDGFARASVQLGAVELWQYISCEQLTLFLMGISRQDECIDAERRILFELVEHLVRVADDGRTAAAAGTADAGP